MLLKDRKRIIQILFAITLAILLANIIAGRVSGEAEEEVPAEVGGEIIDAKFKESVYNFGIKEEWLKSSIKKKGKDTVYTYKVNIPHDLPIPLIIEEISNNLNSKAIVINSKEEKIHGASVLEILSGEKKKLEARLEYSKEISREAGEAGFIVNNIEKLSEEELEEILSIPEPFGVLVTPSKSNIKLAEKIRVKGKEYLIYLSDDIVELEYKLSSRYSEGRLKNSIRSMLGHFSKGAFFVVDDKSSLYNSDIYSFVENELTKRKIGIYKMSMFKELNTGINDKMEEIFKGIVEGIEPGEDSIITISSEDFIDLPEQTAKYRKTGVKFSNPSRLVKD